MTLWKQEEEEEEEGDDTSAALDLDCTGGGQSAEGRRLPLRFRSNKQEKPIDAEKQRRQRQN